MGCTPPPKIISAIAKALEWLVRREGVESILHYLDDYLLVSGKKESCKEVLRKLLKVFGELRVPVAPEKLEGPTTTLKFLGIELNTETMTMQLPASLAVASWLGKRFCMVKELEHSSWRPCQSLPPN